MSVFSYKILMVFTSPPALLSMTILAVCIWNWIFCPLCYNAAENLVTYSTHHTRTTCGVSELGCFWSFLTKRESVAWRNSFHSWESEKITQVMLLIKDSKIHRQIFPNWILHVERMCPRSFPFMGIICKGRNQTLRSWIDNQAGKCET